MQTILHDNNVKSDIFFSIVWQGFKILFLATWVILSAKCLGAEYYGLFNGITGIAFCLSSLSSFGFTYYLLQEGAREPSTLQTLWEKALFVCITGSLIAIISLFCIDIFFNLHIDNFTLLLLAFSELLFIPFTAISASALASQGLVVLGAAIPALAAFVRLAFTTIFWLSSLEKSIENYAYFHSVASFMTGIACVLLTHQKANLIFKITPPKIHDIKKTFLFFVSHSLTNTLGGMDKYLAMKLASPELAGIYTLGLRVTSALIQPIDAAINSLLPRMFKNSLRTAPQLKSIFYYFLAGYIALASLILLIAGDLVFVYMGPDYAQITNSLILFVLLIPATSARLLASSILLTSNQTAKKLVSELIGIICLIIAGIHLIPGNGLDGIVAALLAAEVVQIISSAAFIISSHSPANQQLISKEK